MDTQQLTAKALSNSQHFQRLRRMSRVTAGSSLESQHFCLRWRARGATTKIGWVIVTVGRMEVAASGEGCNQSLLVAAARASQRATGRRSVDALCQHNPATRLCCMSEYMQQQQRCSSSASAPLCTHRSVHMLRHADACACVFMHVTHVCAHAHVRTFMYS